MATYSIATQFSCLASVIACPLRARSGLASRIFSEICSSLKEGHMPMSHSTLMFGAWFAIGVPVPANANVITDWDEKAVAVVMPPGPVSVSQQVYTAQRMMGMVHAALFDA